MRQLRAPAGPTRHGSSVAAAPVRPRLARTRARVAAPEQAAQQLQQQQQQQQPEQQQQQARPPAIAAPASPPVTSLAALPRELRNATALLEAPNPAAPGGKTLVYVLGVSHVSKVSCEQVKQLVRAVQPEVVIVELCRERVALLVDAGNEDRRLETWHCRQVSVEGLPDDDPLWPTAPQLLELLATRLGAAVHTKDVEEDCSRLLATGLFGKARPLAQPATRSEAPQFGAVKPQTDDEDEEEEQAAGSAAGDEYSGEVALQLVPPLGSLRFRVQPRPLPLISSIEVRLDSSLRDMAGGVTAEQLQAVATGLLEAAAAARKAGADGAAQQGKEEGEEKKDEEEKDDAKDKDKQGDADSSLPLYLQLRAALLSACGDAAGGSVVVDFDGVESGRVEALVRARRAADAPFVSGLEGSAAGGEGVGIDSFKPQRSSVQLSPGMLLPAEAAERLAAVRAARQAARVLAPARGWRRSIEYRLWGQDEVRADTDSQLPPNPVVDVFGRLMTGLYAQLQATAGDQVGIAPGAAWRAAMEAATEVGSQQVLLGDRPSDISQRRLATSITLASGARLAAALALLAGGAAAAATHALPDVEAAAAALTGSAAAADVGLAGAAAAAGLALAWPVLAPFLEVWRFSRLSGDEVEEAVAINEPLQANLERPFYVWGEDALLSWPGAEQPLIEERDAFMARVAAAAATGANPNAPGYVADEDEEGQLIWRYAVPEGADAASVPQGGGDGPFKPLPAPAAVVAVVGSAHVRGMCRAWAAALAAPGDVEPLLRL